MHHNSNNNIDNMNNNSNNNNYNINNSNGDNNCGNNNNDNNINNDSNKNGETVSKEYDHECTNECIPSSSQLLNADRSCRERESDPSLTSFSSQQYSSSADFISPSPHNNPPPTFTYQPYNHANQPSPSNSVAFNQQQAITRQIIRVAEYAIHSLKEYGWAVVDNFLGPLNCRNINHEIQLLYESGVFTAGQLMASKRDLTTLDIRSDLIYWFGNNSERDHGAVTIRLLISMIDSIIVHLNKFIPYNICGRSRAMIAVYPGNGTRYVKHVDNPLKDGRCITATYYVNENWNYYQDGGVLRLYPETSATPIDISPQADRLALFWSDRRNPHEVLPSFRNRFAITTWYFDENEKQKALKKKFDNNQQ